MMIVVFSLLVIAVIIAGYRLNKKPTELVEAESELSSEEFFSDPDPSVESLEKKETPEEMEQRLKSMSNPDANKPFAKISVPDISELPSDLPQESAAPKKRTYKKREKTSETPKIETDENSTKPKNRRSKKAE